MTDKKNQHEEAMQAAFAAYREIGEAMLRGEEPSGERLAQSLGRIIEYFDGDLDAAGEAFGKAAREQVRTEDNFLEWEVELANER